jgi:hypothetical protein
MDIVLLPFIYSVWAATSFLILLQAITTRCNVIQFIKCIISFLNQIIQEVFQWMGFLTWKFVISYSGRFWLSILQWIFIIPIVLFTFSQEVYNFGPKHSQRSVIDILLNPVPGIAFEGRISESKDFDLLKLRRFNHNLVARRIAGNAHLSAKRTTQSSVLVIHDCHMAIMSPIAPKIHGYQTYATFHNTSMEH